MGYNIQPLLEKQYEVHTIGLTFSYSKAHREPGWEPLDVLTNYEI